MAAPNPDTAASKGGSKGGSKPGLEAERLAKELEAQRARALARAYVKDKGQCVCTGGALAVCCLVTGSVWLCVLVCLGTDLRD